MLFYELTETRLSAYQTIRGAKNVVRVGEESSVISRRRGRDVENVPNVFGGYDGTPLQG